MISLFRSGLKGLSDSKWAGVVGSAFRVVGIDYRSVPGLIRVHQKLTKISASSGGNQVTELCKVAVPVSDGSTLWFSSESGKIWREVSGTVTLIYTLALEAVDILTASYEKLFQTSVDNSPVTRFSPDGLTMLTMSFNGGVFKRYTLSKAWDISTATINSTNLSVGNARSFFIGNSGKKLFVAQKSSVDIYDIVAWNLAGAQFRLSFDASAQTTDIQDIWFSDDGLKMFLLDGSGEVFEYALSNAWGPDTTDFWTLIQGGGAGGGSTSSGVNDGFAGGGGGGGGNLEDLQAPLTPGAIAVVVGAGGINDAPGSNSSLGSIVATGGGKGGTGTGVSDEARAGGNGGSGGGSGGTEALIGAAGTGTTGQGTNGTQGVTGSSQVSGGGGGGATTAAGAAAVNQGGNGGLGRSSDISGSTVVYGSGGGGGSSHGTPGTAGTGGGAGADGTANGASGEDGDAATTPGSGGGGAAKSSIGTLRTGGAGANGIVIIRYKTAAGINATGGTITTVGDDTIHTFTSNGTFDFSYDSVFSFVDSYDFDTPSRGFAFKDTALFLIASDDNSVRQFKMDAAFDPESATYQNKKLELTGLTAAKSIDISADGDKAYLGFIGGDTNGSTDNIVRQYSLNTSQVKILGSAEHSITVADTTVSSQAFDSTKITPVQTVKLGAPSGNNWADKVAQILRFTRDTVIDRVSFMLEEAEYLNGGYDLKLSIVEGVSNDSPTGTTIVTVTQTVDASAIAVDHSIEYVFSLASAVTLKAGVKYAFILEVVGGSGFSMTRSVFVHFCAKPSTVQTGLFTERSSVWAQQIETHSGPSHILMMRLFNSANNDIGEEEHQENAIYIAIQNNMLRIPVTNIAAWADHLQPAGKFANGHDTHHPMTVQNLSLFIGDDDVLAEVNEVGTFVQETPFNVPGQETITAITPYDIDVLVGTKGIIGGNIYRWDTESDSWNAQDGIFDRDSVTAFLRDDNYVYAVAAPFGRIYFYNGEKIEPYVQIPGDWSPTKTATVHHNAAAFFLNMPVFGLSNVAGNPQLQGVYGLGSYGRGFDKTLSLDFPISAGTFDGVSIGAIIAKGADMMVAWKTASTAGIDKLDYTAKYPSAYIETMMLDKVITSQGERSGRHIRKTLQNVSVPYAELPSNTGVVVSFKRKNEANYTQLDTAKHVTNDENQAIEIAQSVTKVAALQLKAAFTVSGNNAPAIEDILYDQIAA